MQKMSKKNTILDAETVEIVVVQTVAWTLHLSMISQTQTGAIHPLLTYLIMMILYRLATIKFGERHSWGLLLFVWYIWMFVLLIKNMR